MLTIFINSKTKKMQNTVNDYANCKSDMIMISNWSYCVKSLKRVLSCKCESIDTWLE